LAAIRERKKEVEKQLPERSEAVANFYSYMGKKKRFRSQQ
jgi:hypothetical protein